MAVNTGVVCFGKGDGFGYNQQVFQGLLYHQTALLGAYCVSLTTYHT